MKIDEIVLESKFLKFDSPYYDEKAVDEIARELGKSRHFDMDGLDIYYYGVTGSVLVGRLIEESGMVVGIDILGDEYEHQALRSLYSDLIGKGV